MMKRIFCPQTGQQEWGNSTKGFETTGQYRCTKCGALHTKGGGK